MPNQFQNINSGLAELKNYYQGPIKDQFNEEMPIYRAAEKVKQGWSGYQVVRPLRTQRNQGIGATSDGGNLPAIGRQGTVQALIAAKFNYLRFGVTGPMIKASAQDVGSFVRSAAYELEMGYKDLKNDVNRQMSWDGSGTLAQVNANTVASTTLVVKGRATGEPALKFLATNLVFDVVTSGVVTQTGITINAVSGTPSAATATLTLSAPVTAAANATLVRSGSFGYEIQGLMYSLDGGTTTIYNVDRSAEIQYQSNFYDGAGVAQLTLDSIQVAYNAGLSRGGSKYNAFYSNFDYLRYYQKLLTADKRYSNTVKADGTFGNKDQFYMEFMGCPWVPDKDCPPSIFGLESDDWKAYVLAELEFADETGSMYIAQTSADQLEVRLRLFMNMFNEQPSAQFRMTGYLSP